MFPSQHLYALPELFIFLLSSDTGTKVPESCVFGQFLNMAAVVGKTPSLNQIKGVMFTILFQHTNYTIIMAACQYIPENVCHT